MKSFKYIFKSLTVVIVCLLFAKNGIAQSLLSNDICTSLGLPSEISLKDATGAPLTSIESGLEFNITMDVPGGICQGGSYEIFITSSNNLILGNCDPDYPFTSLGTNLYHSALIPANLGQGINVPFKFTPGITCNGEVGSFEVKIVLTCEDGSTKTCVFKKIGLTAKAKNYYTVEKKHVWGNLRGGNIIWDVIIKNNNPNPGIGDYNLLDNQIHDLFPQGTITSVVSYSGAGSVNGLSGLGTSWAKWTIGNIASASTGNPIVYRVTTTSCQPVGTIVKNCINIYGTLGKIFPYPLPSCDKINNTSPICAEVKLVGSASSIANFSKTLSFGQDVLNYAPGCEAEYTIRISNDGNIPINTISLSDIFPSGINGINVTKITISANAVSMPYTTNLGTPLSGSTSHNTNTTEIWNTSNPTSLTFNTSGTSTLLGGYIDIRLRFTINTSATVGAIINNCAKLTYNGTYDGTANGVTICGVYYPPLPAGTVLESCVPFTVQSKKAIPGIRKCITNGSQTFDITDVIPFRIVVSNHGAANFSGNISDMLGSAQNLELVPGSVTYSYGTGSFSPYSTTPGCVSHFSNVSSTPPTWLTVIQQTAQNLQWSTSGLQGNCTLHEAYFLVIEFNARIKPQSFGNYCNKASLSRPNNTLIESSTTCYNIRRSVAILTTKESSTSFVEAGQPFSYTITVTNSGSVALRDVKVEDVLPACITFNSRTAVKRDVNGNTSTANISSGSPPYSFSGLILQPGESVVVTLNVTRKADDKGANCCNPEAIGRAITDDPAAQNIACKNIEGQVCVRSTLCCDINNVEVFFESQLINGNIVPVFFISTGSQVPVQEVEISLMDYHAEYSSKECKPLDIGNLSGHIQPYASSEGNFNSLPPSGTPALQLQTIINPVNNVLTWSGTDPINLGPGTGGGWNLNFNGLIAVNFISPQMLNLECCKGKVYYCFKVRIKDVNCNVCEKIVCGYADIQKAKKHDWKDPKDKDRYEVEKLKQNTNIKILIPTKKTELRKSTK